MRCVYQAKEIKMDDAIAITQPLAIGRGSARLSGDRAFSSVGGAVPIVLETEDQSIGLLEKDDCQVLIVPTKVGVYAEDWNRTSSAARLNDVPFARARLLINDRVSIGDHYHFHFDGRTLCRVPDSQGGKVEVAHLSKVFGAGRSNASEVIAVNDMNFVIKPNEFIGILGPSGCGKSTLLGMLCGAIAPTHGSVRIDAIDIHRDPEKGRSLVGVVPQDDIVHMELSVWQAVRMSASLRLPSKVSDAEKDDLCAQTIAQLGLWEHRHHLVRNLSGGQRKRVSIAVELLKKNKVLFLDEPSSGLDQAREEDLMLLLKRMSNQGRTVICTTHVLDRAYLFSRILVIARGVVVYIGSADEAAAYFGLETLNDVYRHINDPSYLPLPFGLDPKVFNSGENRLVTEILDEVSSDVDTSDYSMQFLPNGALVRIRQMTEAAANAIGKLIRDGEPFVVLDLTLWSAKDASSLDFLTTAIQGFRQRKVAIELISTSSTVRDWLAANRFDTMVPMLDSVESSRLKAKPDVDSEGDSNLALVAFGALLLMGAFGYVLWKLFFAV